MAKHGTLTFSLYMLAFILTRFYSIQLIAVDIRVPVKHSLPVQNTATIDAYARKLFRRAFDDTTTRATVPWQHAKTAAWLLLMLDGWRRHRVSIFSIKR